MKRSVLAAAVLVAVLVAADQRYIGSAASLSLTSQGLTAYRTCTLTATPSTTTAVIDANVRQGSANSNFGATPSANVSTAASANQRIYVRFDLTQCSPTIPSTAIVRLATLRFYMTVVPTACRTVDLFRATASWTETAITWNNQPFGTTINNPASSSATGALTVGTPASCSNQAAGYVTGATVTADVAAFVAGSATNYGWMLRDDVEGAATARTSTFSTKEAALVGQAPQLVIGFVMVP